MRILYSFGIVKEHEQSRTIDQIEYLEDEFRASAKGNGHSKFEISDKHSVVQ